MTTAARPTFTPAIGGRTIRDTVNRPIVQGHVGDLPSFTTLKLRQPGQNTEEEIRRRDLREELRKAEQEYFDLRRRGADDGQGSAVPGDADDAERKLRLMEQAKKLDADDSDDSASGSDSESGGGSDSDDDSDEEDDTAELLRELEKIKKERAAERDRQERERMELEAEEREEEVLGSNPLMGPRDFTVKRRWDDDVVFKNQARGLDEKPKKRFVNDLLRSDFHRRFMQKYIK